jgi:hypothetical protein
VEKLIPLTTEKEEGEEQPTEYLFEPSVEGLLSSLRNLPGASGSRCQRTRGTHDRHGFRNHQRG